MGSDRADAYAYLNSLRGAAGLPGFYWSASLARAAEEHARYLAANGVSGAGASAHEETPGRPGYTGSTPAERARQAGYPHERVAENIQGGANGTTVAVGALMTALYHRLAFLDPLLDEIGIGRAGDYHVFLMGRSDWSALCSGRESEGVYRAPHGEACPGGEALAADYMARWCQSPPASARFAGAGRYYTLCEGRVRVDAGWWERFCAEPSEGARYGFRGGYYDVCGGAVRVQAEWLDGLDTRRLQATRRYVTWPTDGMEQAEPAFYDEWPDPLPDLRVSGAPVSIQFNAARVGRAALEGFRLYRVTAGGRLDPMPDVRLLTAANDPNRRLDRLQFALFPLHRLDWGTRYVAEVVAGLDGEREVIRWTFRTRELGVAVHSRMSPLTQSGGIP